MSMSTEKDRFRYIPTLKCIVDTANGSRYSGDRSVCILLNQINNKADDNMEKYHEVVMQSARCVYEKAMIKKMSAEAQEIAIETLRENIEIWKILKKYNIDSLEKLDRVLFNERVY